MRIVDITLIADRSSPTSRTYLRYLARHGIGLRKILVVDFVSESLRLQRLRSRFGDWVADRLLQFSHPPAPEFSDLFMRFCWDMQEGQDERIDYFSPFRFDDYASETERVAVKSFADPGLHRVLARQRNRAFLYTDGGIVPTKVAEDPSIRIIHVHPGVVPGMRGSDCLMWSLVMRGRPGASCFYMDGGIDSGPLIMTKEFPVPRFPKLASYLREHATLLYRALLHSYDPHLRAQLFLDVVRTHEGANWFDLPATPQAIAKARSWFGMHPRLKEKIMKEVILC